MIHFPLIKSTKAWTWISYLSRNMKYKFGKSSMFGPTGPYFVWYVLLYPQKDWHLRAFSKLFWSRVESWYFRTITFWKYLNISKSNWIKNTFQKVSILSEQTWRRMDCWYLWPIIFFEVLARIHSWYLCKIMVLNFRDFH